MESNYEQIYKNSKEAYDNALNKYLNITKSKEYIESIYSAPFDFLRALYLSKRIELFSDAPAGQKPHFTITSMQEAVSTYKDIMLYKKNITTLLDKASIINQATTEADKINNMVELSNYLEDSLLITYDEKVSSLAKECIKELPKAAKHTTSELRNHYLLDVLTSIKEEDAIKVLATKGMFKKTDINALYSLATTEEEKAGLSRLYKAFDMTNTPVLITSLKLTGVTFEGIDGGNRQNNISCLKEYMQNAKESPSLTLEKFTYTPDLGEPEPAVRVLWGTRDLGFLPKDAALDIHEKYADMILNASVKNVLGGDQVKYGLEINLEISNPVINEEKSEDQPEKA